MCLNVRLGLIYYVLILNFVLCHFRCDPTKTRARILVVKNNHEMVSTYGTFNMGTCNTCYILRKCFYYESTCYTQYFSIYWLMIRDVLYIFLIDKNLYDAYHNILCVWIEYIWKLYCRMSMHPYECAFIGLEVFLHTNLLKGMMTL